MINICEIPCNLDELPKVCVYSIDQTFFSKFYQPEEFCKCGCNKWNNVNMSFSIFEENIFVTPNRIQKCDNCQNIRVSKLKLEIQEIIQTSNDILSTLKNKFQNEEEIIFILKNIIDNVKNENEYEYEDKKKEIIDEKVEKNDQSCSNVKGIIQMQEVYLNFPIGYMSIKYV